MGLAEGGGGHASIQEFRVHSSSSSMDSPSPRLFKFRVFSSSSSFEFEFGELGGADLAFEFELAALAELELELFSRLRPWVPADLASPQAQATVPAQPATRLSCAAEPRQTDPRNATQRQSVSGVSGSGATATLPRERRRNIADVPAPWGVAPQQDAPCGVMASSPATTSTEDARMRRHTSATPRTITGPVVLLSTTLMLLWSGKKPPRNTLPRVSASH